MKTYTDRTNRWERTREGLLVVFDRIRPWDVDFVIDRGFRVEFDSFTSRYDGCQLHRNIINGVVYPFAHRTKGKALSAAASIINLQLNPNSAFSVINL